MKHNVRLGILIVFSGLTLAFAGQAQLPSEDKGEEVTPVIEKGPQDVLHRGTPRGSATGFLEACSEFDFQKATEYLDLRNLPPDISRLGGEELARQLNHVLSRTVWLDEYSINDSPEGAKGDGLPDYRDQLAVIRSNDEEYPIWMQRVPREDGELIWKISNRSLAQVPFLYDRFSFSPPVEEIRGWFPKDASFLGVEAFKWFIIVMLFAICWPVYWILGRIISNFIGSSDSVIHPLVRKLLTGPVVLISTLLTLSIVLHHLGVGRYAQKLLDSKTLIIISAVWAGWAVVDLYKHYKLIRLRASGRPGEAKLVQPVTTLIKLSFLVLGVLVWLNNIGVNITAVLAGFGIGGLAVALALQKPIEDMMGAFSIFSQATLRVGDFCGIGTTRGVVEDIGLRSTRLRTFGNTIVSIPNSSLAYAEIENFTAREKIRYFPILRLRYDSSTEQLRDVTSGIIEMLENDERIDDSSLFSRFTDFGDDAILIKVSSYIKTTNYLEFLKISEELNYGIVDIVRGSGAGFALPGKSIYMEGQPEL